MVSPQAASDETPPAAASATSSAPRGDADVSDFMEASSCCGRGRVARAPRDARGRGWDRGPSRSSSAPVTIWIQYDEMDSLSSSAFWMPPSRNRARTTPAIVPRPPKIETPPSSTAVTAVSSKPWPTLAARRRVAQRDDDAGQRGDHARQDEQDQLDPLDAQAGEARRLLVGADREDRAAERRRVQQHARRRRRARRTARSCSGTSVPAKLPNARSVHVGREVGHRLVADDHEGEAAEQRERADRDGQRRQAEARDEQAVERAAQRADDDAERDDQLERQAVVPQRRPSARWRARAPRRPTGRSRRRRSRASAAAPSARPRRSRASRW